MSEWWVALILIAALAAFAELVSYSGGEDKSHKLAISIILLYSLTAPLVPLVESIGELDISDITSGGEELTGGAYIEVSEEAFCEGISRAVSERFGVVGEKIVVTVTGFDFENMRAERIMIRLLSEGVGVDFKEVENYIETAGLGDCEVKYAFE